MKTSTVITFALLAIISGSHVVRYEVHAYYPLEWNRGPEIVRTFDSQGQEHPLAEFTGLTEVGSMQLEF